MTLEAVIAENTNAIRELIEAIKHGVPTTSAQVAAVAQAPVVQEKKEPKKQNSGVAPIAEMQASTATEAASSSETPPDYAKTSAAVLDLVQAKGNDVTRTLLASFGGATNLKQIDPSKFAEVLEKINAAMGA